MLKTSDTKDKPLLNVPARSKGTSLTMFGSTDSIIVPDSSALKAFLYSAAPKNTQSTEKVRHAMSFVFSEQCLVEIPKHVIVFYFRFMAKKKL